MAIQKGEIYSNHFDLRDKTAVTEDVAISPILVRDGLPQTDTALKSSSVPSKASTNHEGPWLAEFSRFQPFAEDPPRLCSGFFLGHHTHFQGLSSSGTCPWPPSPTPAQSSLRQPRCRDAAGRALGTSLPTEGMECSQPRRPFVHHTNLGFLAH